MNFMEQFTVSDDKIIGYIQYLQKKFKTPQKSNYKRHLINIHKDKAGVCFVTENKKVSVIADRNTIIQGCVKLVNVHNMPLRLMNFARFKDIIDPLMNAITFRSMR